LMICVLLYLSVFVGWYGEVDHLSSLMETKYYFISAKLSDRVDS
jgi:hypothetical protein